MDIKVGDVAEVLIDRPDPPQPTEHVAAVPVDPATAEVLGEFSAQSGQTLDVRIAGWERAFGKPVITTNQAALWAVLQTMKFDTPLPGKGRLLEQLPAG